MENLRFLVADDCDLVRIGVRAYLEEQPGWEVVAEASNGREAVEKAKLLRPEMTILDLSMPELNGLNAAREILKDVATNVLIFTMYDSDRLIQDCLEAGVRGYVLKSDAGRVLVSAVEKLRLNKCFFTPRMAGKVLDGYLGCSKQKEEEITWKNGSRLTRRQRQVLQLLTEGKTNKIIAGDLNISVKTAETHRTNMMRRLNCNSTADLVRYVIRNQFDL